MSLKYTGKCHVYNTAGGPSEILMETGNKYQKQLQQEMPMKPHKWCNSEDHDQNRGKVSCRKPKKGLKHWTGLPQPVNVKLWFLILSTSLLKDYLVCTFDSNTVNINQYFFLCY